MEGIPMCWTKQKAHVLTSLADGGLQLPALKHTDVQRKKAGNKVNEPAWGGTGVGSPVVVLL